MRLVSEKLLYPKKIKINFSDPYIYNVLVFYCVENVCGKSYHNIKRLIKKMAFNSEFNLSDVFSRNALFIELKKFQSDDLWINI